MNIGIITLPVSEAGLVPLKNLVDILYSLAKNLYLVTGGAGYTFFVKSKKVYLYKVEHGASARLLLTRITNYIFAQLKISLLIIKLRRKVEFWVFFIGGESLLVPVLIAKLFRKRVIIASAGSGFKVAQARGDPLAKVLVILQSIIYRFSDKIIMYSGRLIEEHGLQKHRNKICVVHRHFIDFDTFKITRSVKERNSYVGYIGTLSKSKGVPNFLEAISIVSKKRHDLRFIIGGSGQLQNEIKKYLDNHVLNCTVKFFGWIPHGEIPDYMNRLKVLVLPSYTEGLPNIVLEAMACGTPVLATAVGAIPDVIKDGETGFIMEDNSPECIATNIISVLNHPSLVQITRNARALVEAEFTYEEAVVRYRKILSELPAKN